MGGHTGDQMEVVVSLDRTTGGSGASGRVQQPVPLRAAAQAPEQQLGGFYSFSWDVPGEVAVFGEDNDELKYWSSYLGAGSSCVALHLDYNESFSGLRNPARFLTTAWKPQEAIMGRSQTVGARDRATPSAKATVAVHKCWFKRLKVVLPTFFHLLAWRSQLYFKCYRLPTASLLPFHVPAKVIPGCVSPLLEQNTPNCFSLLLHTPPPPRLRTDPHPVFLR